MKIAKPALAGTLESGDAMVRITPLEHGAAVELEIASSVKKQFGAAIRALAEGIISRCGLTACQIQIDDKGALDCVLKARLETAIARAAGLASLPWEDK